jgi:sigma-B regulation protein RsbU (phosphoserine phosphatase)
MPDTRIEIPDWLRPMECILGELNEGVVIVDNQLRVVFANETLLRLGMVNREELQGVAPDAIFPPDDIPFILRQHELGQRYGRNRSEFYLPSKNGERIPAIFSGRSIQGPDGQEYILLVVTDISAQKRIEGQLRESNALLEQHQMEIEAELSLAARVQQSLTPRNLVWNDLSVETYFRPAHKIGGDFGVVFPHSDEALTVLICDVSGHGISSALMANRIYSETLHQLELETSSGNLLRHLHDFVHDRLATDAFYLTMAAVQFTRRGRRATFAAAGHPPAMLVSNGAVRLLDSQNGILGCLAQTAPSGSADEIELAPGDRLVLYTDGLAEVFNSGEDQLGVEGLKTLVHQSAKRALPEMRKAILDGVAAWSHGPLADDVSLVIVEVR